MELWLDEEDEALQRLNNDLSLSVNGDGDIAGWVLFSFVVRDAAVKSCRCLLMGIVM
jgi:hypothetical protein